MVTEKRGLAIRRILDSRRDDFVVVVENIHDKHNIGAVARTFDCVGGLHLYIINTQNISLRNWYVSSIRADRWLCVHIFDDVDECYAELRGKGFRILAGDAGGGTDLYDLDFTSDKIALVFGEEHAGLSPRARETADGIFTIPQAGASDSLNISVAAAVTLYELFRQKRDAGQAGTTLRKEEYDFLLRKWSSVKPADRLVVSRRYIKTETGKTNAEDGKAATSSEME